MVHPLILLQHLLLRHGVTQCHLQLIDHPLPRLPVHPLFHLPSQYRDEAGDIISLLAAGTTHFYLRPPPEERPGRFVLFLMKM